MDADAANEQAIAWLCLAYLWLRLVPIAIGLAVG